MRQTWTDTHFGLRATDQPTICSHAAAAVSLSLPGYRLDGYGFTLVFTRAHLEVARRLVDALEALEPLASEDTPFADAPGEGDLSPTARRKPPRFRIEDTRPGTWHDAQRFASVRRKLGLGEDEEEAVLALPVGATYALDGGHIIVTRTA
jgi:hypothetical protein